jgi:iron complex outermembrane receptor protein
MTNRSQAGCSVRRFLGAFAGILAIFTLGTSALAAADLSHAVRFTIPEQPMRDALLAFSAQANVQVVAEASLVNGKRSATVNGSWLPERALAILLEGSGLGYRIVHGNTFAIRALDGAQSNAAQDPGAASGAALEAGSSTRVAQTAATAPNGAAPDADKSGNGPGVRAEDRTTINEIVVTGSRLASTTKEGAQDVLLYTRQQIDNSGQTSVSDFLNTLTDVSVATTGGGEQTFAGAGTARLHGLPVGTTLVLINGRPVETTGGQAFFGINIFDMNSIPLAAVERIEVLPSGSSAIYGSDGLAGVVNIILKKEFDGLEANAKYGGASGTNESDAHVAWGDKWNKGSLSIIGSYQRIGEMDGFARTLTGTQDYTPYGGPDTRQAFCPRSNVYSTTGAPLPGLGSATFAGVPAGYTGTPTQSEFLNSPLNTCSYFGYISQIPGAEREGLNLNAHYELTPSLDLFTEIMVSHALVKEGQDPPIVFGFPGYTPYTVSAANPHNPFGQTVGISGLLTSFGRSFDELPTTFFRPLVGLRGSAFGNWSWEVVGFEARDQSSYRQTNQISPLALFSALNSPNPSTALNPFIDGAPGSPALLQTLLAPDMLVRNTSSRTTGNGFLRGPLFSLPAGPVEVVVGAEYIRDQLTAEEINYPGGTGSYRFQRSSYAGFAEARIPILAGSGDPAAGDVLALNLAGREDHYDQFGSKSTPQVSMEWRPTKSFLVRGSYGRSFRAPSLEDLLGPTQTGNVALISDPQHGGQSTVVSYNTGGNPGLQPETGKSTTLGVVYSSVAVPDLRLSLNQWRVQENDSVQSLQPQVLVDNESLFPGRVVRNSAGVITTINGTFINFGNILVEGLDYRADYTWRTSAGDLTPSISATETYRYESALLPGQPSTDRLSAANGDGNWAPRWKIGANLSWKSGPYAAHADGRYVSRYRDYDPLPNGSTLTLGDFWLYDANFRFAFGQVVAHDNWLKGAYVELGAVNLFNTLPQFSMYNGGVVGYDPMQGDLRGRFVYAQFGIKW